MPRKSQFTDEQIIRALREVDAGAKPAAALKAVLGKNGEARANAGLVNGVRSRRVPLHGLPSYL